MSSVVSCWSLRSKDENRFMDCVSAVVLLPLPMAFPEAPEAILARLSGGGGSGGEAIKLGLKGRKELVEYSTDTFIPFFEVLGFDVCEREDEAVDKGRG
jgi:hypothetical protein